MSDIVSNVLIRSEGRPEREVRAFLEGAEADYASGVDLLNAAAQRFAIDAGRLAELVERWSHINCQHAALPGYVMPDSVRNPKADGSPAAVPFSAFAADVTLHVVLHELGHAVIREFDLMVLANEETMADAFATHVLVEHFPELAVRAITARVRSLMIEADEVPRDQWSVHGEHDNDARRAYQIAALAIAADPQKFADLAGIVGMSERNIKGACDYGADIHRAWRRTLSPLLMPAGRASREARLRADDATHAFVYGGESTLASALETALGRFDWHSQITVDFVGGSGGASWNRSARTVTVHSEYLARFSAQGLQVETGALPAAPDPR
jgi:hypothetical protein